jgi:thioesterase domain-containing protein/acyl carrier protein
LSFDIAGLELYLPLSIGARVVLASREVARDGTQLLTNLKQSGATVMQATPATWRLLTESGWNDMDQLKMLCGGEALPRDLANQMVKKGGELWNLYGPTETTIWSTLTRIHSDAGSILIGRPIANTQVYVVDSNLQPVPIGVAGELLIGGAGVARGYRQRPDLTSERFIPNPFGAEPGSRLYRTGDLVRYIANGELEYIARVDNQVKIRGYRIELGEVEAALAKHEGVRERAVAVREDVTGEKRLVAYLVLRRELAQLNSELRGFLIDKLPEYMIPTTYVVLDQLPLTPNGKVDRKALPAPDGSRPELESRYQEPRTSLEKLLAEMWQDVLGVDAIGIHDDFFELGGTSIRVVVFVNRLEKRLHVPVPVKALFGAPNVAALAEYLKEHYPQITLDEDAGELLSLMTGLRPDDADSWSPLVEIQPGTGKTPLFFVHPVGGNVFCYFNLARRLGEDQPFYALQAKGLNDGQPGHTRIEEMASYYVEHLRTVQPTGPYRIGGWSLGGVVAFEMARQLKASGDDVPMLTLIDSPSPSAFSEIGQEDELLQLANFALDLGFTQQHLSRSFDDVRQLSLQDQLAYMLDRALAENLVPAGMDLDHLHRLFRVFKTNMKALRAYVPGEYAGHVTYVRAAENDAGDMSKDWRELALGGVDVHQLPGDHYSILKQPHVDALAQCIERQLQNGDGAPHKQ